MIVLMDPPEEDGYKWAFKARLVKVCSNNYRRHFFNVEKFLKIKVLYPAMPKLEEIFAMAKVLWKDATSNFVGKTCKDKKEMMNILAMRSFLVGCVPRHLFSFTAYKGRLEAIENAVKELGLKEETLAIFAIANEVLVQGAENLGSVTSRLYNLDGGDFMDEQAMPMASLNGYARGLLLPLITYEKPNPIAFVLLVEQWLVLGGILR
jgi:hypothetical protein